MPEHNPYQPPKAPVAQAAQRPRNFLAVGLAAVALLLGLAQLPSILELVRVGALTPLRGLGLVIALLFGLFGAILSATRKRAAIYLLGIGAAVAVLATVSWPSALMIGCSVFMCAAFAAALRR